MQKLFSIILPGFFLIFSSCHSKNNTNERAENINAENASIFPVTSFLKGQLRIIDSMATTPLKLIISNGKTDSIWLKRNEVRSDAASFLVPEIDSVSMSPFFSEKSFLDQTINAFTFSYDPKTVLPDSLHLTHWDVYINPQTGEVLALANYPTFDPRHEQPTPEEAEARHKNIAVQIPCEPGSVMKMITVTMGIDSGRFTPSSGIFCENGSFARPGRRAIHDLHRMGNMDVAGILIKSSNIGVAKISIASGPKTLYDYLKRFGIGEKTGIELPAESRGLLRHLECRDSKDRWCWSPASHEYIAFGHEVGATAIQLARAVSVIANGGLLVNPHIVLKKSRPTDDGHVQNVPIEFKSPIRVIRPETAFTIRRIMESVVEEGTGRRAAVPGYSSGGKTGSAEIFENGAWQNRHNSSFIGFAPVTNPRVVVVVTLNRTPKQGGIAAAPIFSKVTETALRVLQVPKDRPESDIQPKPLTPAETDELPENRVAKAEALKKEKEKEKEELEKKKLQAADQEPEAKPFSPLLVGPKVPDFRGMPVVAVLRQSATLGLPVEIVGRGKARVQKPAPGTILSNGERIQVEFSAAQ